MKGIGVTTAMVAIQFLHVGLNTLIKASISNGMSNFVFAAYSNLLSFCFLLPSTLIYHRNKAPPPINIGIIFRIIVIGVLGITMQTLMYTGLRYSSPTLSSTMEDLIPAFTFIIAIISSMEKLDLKLRSSQAKTIGTVVSIAGALTVTLYQGLPITSDVLPNNGLSRIFLSSQLTQQSEWVLGGILLAAGSFCVSLLLIMQTWTIKDYPAELMLTTVCSSLSVVLSFIVAFIAEENPKAWMLKPDMELVSIFYSATLMSLRGVVSTWACRKKGPVYVAMFNPLGIAIALVMGVTFLGDVLYLGSMIGATIIAIGFYAVMWGQTQEEKMTHEKCGTCSIISSPSSTAPLLANKSKDTSTFV